MQDTDVNTNAVASSSSASDNEECVVVEEEVHTPTVGKYVGQCKWFNDLLGYGFVTVCDGNDKGKDIFVHHSGIMPLNSNYRTLKKGEYLNFNIVDGMNGLQAVDVTGINGGPLMCDFVSVTRTNVASQPNQNTYVPRHTHTHTHPHTPTPSRSVAGATTANVSTAPASPHPRQASQQSNNHYQAISNALGSQWYVVTKTGRKKNLAKYSKEGRALMKQAKQGVMQQQR